MKSKDKQLTCPICMCKTKKDMKTCKGYNPETLNESCRYRNNLGMCIKNIE